MPHARPYALPGEPHASGRCRLGHRSPLNISNPKPKADSSIHLRLPDRHRQATQHVSASRIRRASGLPAQWRVPDGGQFLRNAFARRDREEGQEVEAITETEIQREAQEGRRRGHRHGQGCELGSARESFAAFRSCLRAASRRRDVRSAAPNACGCLPES